MGPPAGLEPASSLIQARALPVELKRQSIGEAAGTTQSRCVWSLPLLSSPKLVDASHVVGGPALPLSNRRGRVEVPRQGVNATCRPGNPNPLVAMLLLLPATTNAPHTLGMGDSNEDGSPNRAVGLRLCGLPAYRTFARHITGWQASLCGYGRVQRWRRVAIATVPPHNGPSIAILRMEVAG